MKQSLTDLRSGHGGDQPGRSQAAVAAAATERWCGRSAAAASRLGPGICEQRGTLGQATAVAEAAAAGGEFKPFLCLSVVVSIKRFVIGQHLGRQQSAHYGQPLARAMQEMLLIGEVASLARHIERSKQPVDSEQPCRPPDLAQACCDPEAETNVLNPTNRDPLTGSLNNSEKMKLDSKAADFPPLTT